MASSDVLLLMASSDILLLMASSDVLLLMASSDVLLSVVSSVCDAMTVAACSLLSVVTPQSQVQ